MSQKTQNRETQNRDRKAEHIQLALDPRMQVEHSSFDSYRFGHDALPEIDFDDVRLETEMLGRRLRGPLLISCMTGGTGRAASINHNLAIAAERCKVAVGVGSQRKALEDPAQAATFEIRHLAPSVPILANLGAVQLNYGYGVDECRRAVEMVDADALVLHLNPVQEAIQPEGDRRFGSLLPRIAEVVEGVGVPVIAKEVGNGLSRDVAERLQSVGVQIVDTAGVGGTSWARIEAARADDVALGEVFADWGITTPESIRQCAAVAGVEVIGSGGVRHGVDVAKAIALGAHWVGMAYRFLAAAMESPEAVEERIERTLQELRITMFCLGARDLQRLRQTPLLHAGG